MWHIIENIIDSPLVNEGEANNHKPACSVNYRAGTALDHIFRLCDDDGNVYFIGVSDRVTVRPLDDYGAPGYGCAYIEFWDKGAHVWETL